MEYPCKDNGRLTDLDRCFMCKDKMKCDVYATMLDEVHDCEKD